MAIDTYSEEQEQELLPPLTELEEQQEWNQELLKKINDTKKLILELETNPKYLIIKLKKLYKL